MQVKDWAALSIPGAAQQRAAQLLRASLAEPASSSCLQKGRCVPPNTPSPPAAAAGFTSKATSPWLCHPRAALCVRGLCFRQSERGCCWAASSKQAQEKGSVVQPHQIPQAALAAELLFPAILFLSVHQMSGTPRIWRGNISPAPSSPEGFPGALSTLGVPSLCQPPAPLSPREPVWDPTHTAG